MVAIKQLKVHTMNAGALAEFKHEVTDRPAAS